MIYMDMPGQVIFHEQYGSSELQREYVTAADGRIKVIEKKSNLQSTGRILRSIFLPQGYPESVSDDYTMYQVFDTMQAFASSITGTLATQALLKGIGVGDSSATALAATITWILKDGTGMLGRIMFAWLQGSSLDCDAKRWRLFADVLNDFATCLEIAAPFFPLWFTLTVCVAGVCKSIVGVAGGATRAALTMHQARRNNMADVSAKDGSQETLVNFAALLCSLALMPLVAENYSLVWTLFIIFTCVHLWANYSAVTSVVMESLNQARLHILVSDFLLRVGADLPSVRETNAREPVFLKTNWLYNICMGSELGRISNDLNDLQQLEQLYSDEKYLVGVNLKEGKVRVILRRDSDIAEQLMAAFQAELINVIAIQTRGQGTEGSYSSRLSKALVSGDAFEISRTSLELTKNLFPHFLSQLKSGGWITSHLLLGTDEWRAHWGSERTSKSE